MRRGVWFLLLSLVLAAAGAASAYADGTTTTTTTTTTTSTTTTATTTTATTTTTPTQPYSRLVPAYLPAGCVGAGDAAIAVPGRQVIVLGTPAYGRGASSYPETSPIVRFLGASASGSSCATAHVVLSSVSLFGGAVTASSVSATHGQGYVSGVKIYGSGVTLRAGHPVGVGGWGQVMLQKTVGRLTAPLVVQLLAAHHGLPAGTTVAFAFGASPQAPVAHPRHKHHPAGGSKHSGAKPGKSSSQKASAKGQGKTKHRHHKRAAVAQPLTATPSLGFKSRHYAFPIDGGASYVDTYGGNRNDIYDGWHHGDDLFAPLGTPVVAVARGTLSLVGWNTLGGWRLWLTDRKGNSFYYAHLAGYARWILTHRHVRAGQVIGFLGRTGDAFTTTPHLHFEIHPHLYVDLGYDGAVDPTRYLQSWKIDHVPADQIPMPAKLKAPVGTPQQEATVVWRQLLAARHLLPAKGAAAASGSASLQSPHRAPFPHPPSYLASGALPLRIAYVSPTAAHVSASTTNMPLLVGGPLGGVLALSAGVGTFLFRRRRRVAAPAAPEASG